MSSYLARAGGVALGIVVGLAGCGGEPDDAGDSMPSNQQVDSGGQAPPVKPPQTEPSRLDVAPADESVVREMALNDAALDGWPSEVLNTTAGGALQAIFATVIQDGSDPPRELVSEDVRFSPFVIDEGNEARVVAATTIERSGSIAVTGSGRDELFKAIDTFAQSLGEQARSLKLKVIRSSVEGDRGATEVIVLASGHRGAGLVQYNADWTCTWNLANGPEDPELTGIEVLGAERLVRERSFFSDCTEAVFASSGAWEQLSRGFEHWWGRLDFALGGTLGGHYGVAVGDIDNDGLEDLYICQPGLLTNRLLRHNPDGTVTDISAGSGADLLNDTIAALILDVNNDGYQDIVAGTVSHILVLQGDGRGRFTPRFRHPVLMSMSLAAADYDNDGLVDVYVTQYAASGVANATTGPLYDSEQGLPNILLRNVGEFRFVDVTDDVGLGMNNTRQSFAAAWEDFDNDGDQDLYVANDFGRNNLYRNENGNFVDVAAEFRVEDQAAGMGVAWGDYDRDGLVDLFVTNMYSGAGNRITFNEQFSPQGGTVAANNLQYFSRGNTLFRNTGVGFEDVSTQAGITMGRFAWGARFIDFNNDGWLDVACPNGFITNRDSGDL